MQKVALGLGDGKKNRTSTGSAVSFRRTNAACHICEMTKFFVIILICPLHMHAALAAGFQRALRFAALLLSPGTRQRRCV